MLKKRLVNRFESLFLYIFRDQIQNQKDLIEKINKFEEQMNDKIHTLENENEELKKLIKSEIGGVVNQNNYIKANLNRSDKTKILLAGFYGAPNCGDEYMLETLLDYLSKDDSIDITVMLADNDDYIIHNEYRVNYIHYPNSNVDCNIFAHNYDVLVWGGGAIIDESEYSNVNSYKTSLGSMIIHLSEAFQTFEKNVYYIGVSSSKELQNHEYIDRLKKVLDKSVLVSIRDKYSYEYLKKTLGFESIVPTEDIVLSNKTIFNNIRKETKKEIEKIGIIWISDYSTESQLKELIEQYKDKYKKAKIVLIPFYGYLDQDVNFYKYFIDKYKIDNVEISDFPYTINSFVKITNDIDYIISLRYHGILLANALNIPCLSICYDKHCHYLNKVTHINELFENKNIVKLSKLTKKEINQCLKYNYANRYNENINLMKNIINRYERDIKNINNEKIKK